MKSKIMFDIETLPPLQKLTSTFWGEVINAEDDHWVLNDLGFKTTLDFSKYSNLYIKHIVKLFLSTLSYSKSLSHVYNFEAYLSKIQVVKPVRLQAGIINFINTQITKSKNTEKEYQLWYLKSWYVWCSDLDLPYFCRDYSEYLENLSISGNLKGQAVMSLEENDGPFNDFELSTIVKLLKEDTEESVGKLLAYLFLTLGANPRNILLLKWADFTVFGAGDLKVYLLQVPRIKKRSKARTDFKTRELDRRVGSILEKLKKGADDSEYIFSNASKPLTTLALRSVLSRYMAKLLQNSELKALNVTPRRFRYTFATRLVMAGVSKERLADLLDHSDLQNVQIYYDLRHQIKGFLTEVETKELGTLLRNFEGTINNDTSVQKDIKYYTLKANSALGKCGSDASCELNAPYSCFVCPKFNAFSDSLDSYKEVHSDLMAWKKTRKDEFNENDRIQFQMDEVISALTDLILKIEGDLG